MQHEPHTDLRPWFRTIADVRGMIDWPDFFQRDLPVQLDIGCGRGLFLFNSAMRHPDINYLGLELDYREGRRAARRLEKRELPNARVIGGDCRTVLEHMIQPQSVAAAHVYFPDPWWKKRHHRRRLFTDDFVKLLARVVKCSGLVHSWTDVDAYFTVISSLMNHSLQFETCAAPTEHMPRNDMDYQTSFERKKRKAGFLIRRGLWRRSAVDTGATPGFPDRHCSGQVPSSGIADGYPESCE